MLIKVITYLKGFNLYVRRMSMRMRMLKLIEDEVEPEAVGNIGKAMTRPFLKYRRLGFRK
jgi:hypothetical protein